MFTTDLKRIGIVCGIGILLLLLWKTTSTQSNVQPELMATRRQHQPPAEKANLRNRSLRATTSPRTSTRDDLQQFQASAFYRTIVDNNIFRPLGWTPKAPRAAYRLIGTIIPVDGVDGKTGAQAIIQTIPGNKTHIVGIGDTLAANVTVTHIENKQVTLNKLGKQTTLKLDVSRWISGAKQPRNTSQVTDRYAIGGLLWSVNNAFTASTSNS